MRSLHALPALLLAAAPAIAQFGNGCNGDLETTVLVAGSNLTVTVKGGANQAYGLFLSDSPGPVVIPGFGTISLDVFSPAFFPLASGALNGSGVATFTAPIPNDAVWQSIVFYGQAVVADPACPTGWAITRGIRFDFEPPDTFVALPTMSTARALATGSLLQDGRVFVAGGGGGSLTAPSGTGTSELYSPFSRTWAPGPNLGLARAFHEAVTLSDGRVLLIGGADATGGVTASCEIFDPALGVMTPASSMNAPRAGCTATLLNNGKVLVTGGTNTFQIPAGTTSLAPILNAAQNDGEVYDPAIDVWTYVPGAMASKRMMHAAALLQNGKVLVVSGVNGATNLLGTDVPAFTQTCNLYNPATNAWEAAAQLPAGIFGVGGIPGRGGHRVTTMNNGEVFMAGGLASVLGIPGATATTGRYTPATNSWASAGTMPQAVGMHGQVLLKNGKAHVSGGASVSLSGSTIAFSAVADCATRVQATSSFTTTTAMPQATGGHLAVRLHDGSVLMVGGGDASGAATAAAYHYTPAP
ncbi:MAG TPA: hypothetical protein VEI02_11680 [Planctomycetota bacterium]|nr:hypothetical protein [Planctomycetota bacterium]